MPHRLDDRQVHQPDFLKNDPITEIPDNRLWGPFNFPSLLRQQEMGEWVAAKLSFQHFARPGGREASFFYLQNVGERFRNRRHNGPSASDHAFRLMRAPIRAVRFLSFRATFSCRLVTGETPPDCSYLSSASGRCI